MDMSRLADYFVVVGYDHDKEPTRGGQGGTGKILQRFPEKDWDDVPFHQGLELFCQPAGWNLSSKSQPPTFHVSVLTDIEARRHYCAVLTFSEPVKMNPSRPDDLESDEVEGSLVRHTLMFAPKCLSLISRLEYFETLRNCLGLLYTVYVDSLEVEMETLVGNILGHVQVPPPGGPQVRFSIGAGDRQALQPPLSDSLPVTRSSVALLVQQLGIHNVITLFAAMLTDQKILFHCRSYTRLTEACGAIISLLFPLKYSYVYIPVLPAALVEVLSTPTPFIMGVHSALKDESQELLDVVVADLDGGYISIPECVNMLLPSEAMYNRVHMELTMVLRPDRKIADQAFPGSGETVSKPELLDKEIRAIFLRLMAELLMGYRSCLTIIRIHPSPVITFNKGMFLFQRGLLGDEFLSKLLDGMAFGTFVNERGPPYRQCDLFDKLLAIIQENLAVDSTNPDRNLKGIRDVAERLYVNENPSILSKSTEENPTKAQYLQKIPKPTEGAHTRIHQVPFPTLASSKVQDVIEDGQAKAILQSMNPNLLKPRTPKATNVPYGPPITSYEDHMNLINNSARRLEVLKTCINFIFENKILDARRLFPAVMRSLKSRVARQALLHELEAHVSKNRAMLEPQQFGMVVRLMNAALQEDSNSEEFSLSMDMLPLITAFCRKLCPGIIQFAYTVTQDHPVFASQQFWETAFYADVEKNIRGLYVTDSPVPEKREVREGEAFLRSFASGDSTSNSASSSSANGLIQAGVERSALEIAAEQLRLWPGMSLDTRDELIKNEESIVYSQAVHYANRMVCFRVPLDASRGLKNSVTLEGDSGGSSNMTGSLGGSDSYDADSNFEEGDPRDVPNKVIKFISRFVDKVCTEAGVSHDHLKNLHGLIPGLVAMHIETLDGVNRESKRLPPIQKPKILKPNLLPGEEKMMEGLRGYLVLDGREEGQGGVMGGPTLLPAEGAVFLTNYRIIFKGTPIDMQACEQVVTRSFPVSALSKEKKINVTNIGNLFHLDQFLSEGIQLRSNTFQLMKIVFDAEVSLERLETFRKTCNKLRYPQTIFHTFAYPRSLISPALSTQMKHKEKSATLRKFATKTFLRGGKKSASKISRKDKYVLPPGASRLPVAQAAVTTAAMTSKEDTLTASMESIRTDSRPSSALYDDDEQLSNIRLSSFLTLERGHAGLHLPQVIDEGEGTSTLKPNDVLTVDKLADRLYVQDYQRLGLGLLGNGAISRPRVGDMFKISEVNIKFEVARSYPALIVVPSALSDDSIRRLAKCHRHGRLPAIVWRHTRTKGLLIRSSGFHGKGVMGMIRGAQNQGSSASDSGSSKSLEQEKYLSAIVLNTPYGSYHKSDSLVSLNAILPPTSSGETPDGTPTISPRKGQHGSGTLLQRGFLRSSGGSKAYGTSKPGLFDVGVATLRRGQLSMKMGGGRMGAFGHAHLGGGVSPAVSKKHLTLGSRSSATRNGSVTEQDLAVPRKQEARKAALYVFGEKSQMRALKVDSQTKCDFIPYDFFETRQIKASFKKLMKACLPSNPITDPEMGFHKMVGESEWLLQIQNIMQLSGAAVDLIDLQGSSVWLSFEDGWDFTTQVSSLAQLLMDPYYRTLTGFKVLVDKEWLAFGHRFTHRSNQTVAHQASGFAPVFLQFLDCVHQVHCQFPLSFEFNQYFLKMIAYHYVSNRFQTFMWDSDYERYQAATQVYEERRPSRIDESGDSDSETSSPPLKSLWAYIDKYHGRSPLFYNLQFAPHTTVNEILRPYTNISSLKVWDFYLEENLYGGPSFDRELFEAATNEDNEQPLEQTDRRTVNACYDDASHAEPDIHRWLMEELHQLESDLGKQHKNWRHLLEHLETRFVTRRKRTSQAMEEARVQSMTAHKKTTIDILVRGKHIGEPQTKGFNFPHHFEPCSYVTPTSCDYCNQMLFGVVKQGCTGMKCADCGYNVHEKCVPQVPKQCMRRGSTKEHSSAPARQVAKEDSNSSHTPTTDSTPSYTGGYEQFNNFVDETRSHEGHLYKRGARLKGWKQRWFVLDSQKHQLRYYESRNDPHCKGFIDLKEVESVQPAFPNPSAPKKCEESAFFDLKTTKRVYNFISDTKGAAEEWISKIQDCLS
ncbi:LOW QUALITY PROTEIN: myotubularin-related protein 13-like [Diadema antillarum]|uniref:LOW QUALITY PROTEIN: myotubularin-related protein 13-like n=1 Tax=Diadema antillarum TaxID=105358 RepID=UPI003A8C85AF